MQIHFIQMFAFFMPFMPPLGENKQYRKRVSNDSSTQMKKQMLESHEAKHEECMEELLFSGKDSNSGTAKQLTHGWVFPQGS